MVDLLDRFRVDWSQDSPPEPPRITPTFRDLVTGAVAKYPEQGWSLFWWTDGNGACDCNRMCAFSDDEDDTNECLGCKRYIAIDVEAEDGPIDDVTKAALLAELNEGYPHG